MILRVYICLESEKAESQKGVDGWFPGLGVGVTGHIVQMAQTSSYTMCKVWGSNAGVVTTVNNTALCI